MKFNELSLLAEQTSPQPTPEVEYNWYNPNETVNFMWNVVKVIDPTGVTNYKDLYRASVQLKDDPNIWTGIGFTIALVSALPFPVVGRLLGKGIGATAKIAKGISNVSKEQKAIQSAAKAAEETAAGSLKPFSELNLPKPDVSDIATGSKEFTKAIDDNKGAIISALERSNIPGAKQAVQALKSVNWKQIGNSSTGRVVARIIGNVLATGAIIKVRIVKGILNEMFGWLDDKEKKQMNKQATKDISEYNKRRAGIAPLETPEEITYQTPDSDEPQTAAQVAARGTYAYDKTQNRPGGIITQNLPAGSTEEDLAASWTQQPTRDTFNQDPASMINDPTGITNLVSGLSQMFSGIVMPSGTRGPGIQGSRTQQRQPAATYDTNVVDSDLDNIR